ncbi:metallophosphoesterase [Pseudoruegeria sp. HB172150]|uniref:metallophosphoesterase family protein n=1 Tax=Pseudoruegeria sp. HB172150 TaxID=2721164 RepID=UPI0015531916|nr:metallophosphoesterase [Pseudoruegeria sp. HB172150]
MRLLAFSDVHCDLDACAALVAAGAGADLVIGAGDFAQRHEGLEETMAALSPLEDKAVYIPGNNETADALRAATSAMVLHGTAAEVVGLRIFGLGCAVPPLPPLPWGSFDMEEAEAATLLQKAEGADILVSHSPPKGIADEMQGRGSIGSEAVRAAAMAFQPRLLVCGHVHDCWGQTGEIGLTHVRNLGPTVNWFEL